MDEALRILATYETLGIKELWLTPHIMEDIPNTPHKLRTRFEELKAAYNGSIELHLAAEYMIDNHLRNLLQEIKNSPGEYPQGEISPTNNCPSCVRGASNAVAEGDRSSLLPIGTGGRHILVETSYYNAPMEMRETLQQIRSLSYTPLLAHPERYMYLDYAEYVKLHNEGVKFQLNLASLAGGYGKIVKEKAEWLLSNGLYSVAGTDLHSEESIEFITNCKLSKQAVEQIERLLHSSI